MKSPQEALPKINAPTPSPSQDIQSVINKKGKTPITLKTTITQRAAWLWFTEHVSKLYETWMSNTSPHGWVHGVFAPCSVNHNQAAPQGKKGIISNHISSFFSSVGRSSGQAGGRRINSQTGGRRTIKETKGRQTAKKARKRQITQQTRERQTTKQTGVTLVELMISIVIIAIIATIAIPSYTHYLTQSRRTEAQTALLDLATRMEQYYSENHQYDQSNGSAPTFTELGINATTPNGYYTLSIPQISNTSYTLQATPSTQQANDDPQCLSLTLTSQGQKGATGTTTNPLKDCW